MGAISFLPTTPDFILCPKFQGRAGGGGKWNFAPYPVCQGTIRFE